MPLSLEKIISLRKHIADAIDQDKKNDEIASIKPLESIPAIIAIIDDIKQITENNIKTCFRSAVSIDFDWRFEKTKDNMSSTIKEIYGKNLDVIYNKLHNKKKITQDSMTKAIKKISTHLCMLFLKEQVDTANIEINQKNYQNLLSAISNELILTIIQSAYKQVDELQNKALVGSLLTEFKESMNFFSKTNRKQRITIPFELIINSVHLIESKDDTKVLYQELMWWCRGLYQFVYNKIPKEHLDQDGGVKLSDGYYPTIDSEDLQLRSNANGLTKYAISLYHRQFADMLHNMLSLTLIQDPLSVDQTVPVPQPEITESKKEEEKLSDLVMIDSDASSEFVHIEQEVNDTVPKDDSLTINQTSSNGRVCVKTNAKGEYLVSAHVPSTQPSVAMRLFDFSAEWMSREKEMGMSISTMLFNFDDEETGEKNKEKKRKILENWVVEGKTLTYDENLILFSLPVIVKSRLTLAINHHTNIFGPPIHAPSAKSVIKDIEKTDVPIEQLRLLFQYRQQISRESSKHILPAIDKILDALINILIQSKVNVEKKLHQIAL